MGEKKRCPPVKPPPLPPSTAIDSASNQDTLDIADHPALCAIQTGDFQKALEMIKQPLYHHKDSSSLHCIAAVIHRNLAGRATEDYDKEIKHLTDAVHSAELAVEGFPNSVQVASLLASLLYRWAKLDDKVEWDKVIQVCNQALKIENSTDPGILDKLLEKDEIVNVRRRINNLLQDSECQKNLNMAYKEVEEMEESTLILGFKVKKLEGVKSEVKKLEERRNEFQGTVSKLRDFHGKFGSLHLKESLEMGSELLLDSGGSRKKGESEMVATFNFDKVKNAKSYWISGMNIESKMGLLNMRIEDVKTHLESVKDRMGMNLLMEAVSSAQNKKTWKFWECCVCYEKYGDFESYCKHFDSFHQVNIGIDLGNFLSHQVDGNIIEFILHGEWKPVNTDEAVEIIINRSKSESSSIVDEEWPLSNEKERAESLENIRDIFQWLVKRDCLYASHVKWVEDLAVAEIRTKIAVTTLASQGLLTLKLLCFSGASQLKFILEHMNIWVASLGNLSENPQTYTIMDDQLSGEQSFFHIKEWVVFIRDDVSRLLMDKRLLQGELDMVAYDRTEGTSADDVCKDDVLLDSDELVSWLYAGSLTVEEAVDSWTSLRESQKEEAKRVYEIHNNECLHLKRLFKRKSEDGIMLDAALAIENIFKSELQKRKEDPNYEKQPFVSLFIEHEKYLRLQLDFISNVLEEQREEPDFGMQEHSNQEEDLDYQSQLKELKHLIHKLSDNLYYYDALIIRSHTAMTKYKRLLGQASAYDYRSIVLPLLKSFMQSRLEDQINKNHGEG